MYFGTESNPELKFSDVTETNKQLEDELVDGETYYWKVVPSVNGVPGPESEIWSFTVDFAEAPFIDFSLTLDETTVDLRPEEKIFINGSVKKRYMARPCSNVSVMVHTKQVAKTTGSL